MKTLILTNSDIYALPSIYKLAEKQNLVGIAYPSKSEKTLLPALSTIGVPVKGMNKQSQQQELYDWISELEVGVVLVISWPYILDKSLLSHPKHGIYNIHFGLLPQEQGPDPIFWALRNGKSESGITIHRMTEELDKGPILLQEKVAISNLDNYGSYAGRMAYETSVHLDVALEKIEQQEYIQESEKEAVYLPKVADKDLVINWESMSSSEIIWLVQATNPRYGGAQTIINGTEIRILEAELANMNQPPIVSAGSIVHADQVYGIIVMCADFKCLKLSVVHMREGYASGTRLFYMGFKPGDKFMTIPLEDKVTL